MNIVDPDQLKIETLLQRAEEIVKEAKLPWIPPDEIHYKQNHVYLWWNTPDNYGFVLLITYDRSTNIFRSTNQNRIWDPSIDPSQYEILSPETLEPARFVESYQKVHLQSLGKVY